MDELQRTREGSRRASTRGGTGKGKEATRQRQNWEGEWSRRPKSTFDGGGKAAIVIQREERDERVEDRVDLGSEYEFRD